MVNNLKIIKAVCIKGKTLHLRSVEKADAEFILSLRLDEKKSAFISKIENDLSAQERWIQDYLKKDDQAYFIIIFNNIKIGTVRIYDSIEDSFSWGSWILNSQSPIHASIESALIIYKYGFNILGFKKSHFDVRKKNKSVCKFHERFGATLIGEDLINNYYSITKEAALKAFERYDKYLDDDLMVVY